MFCKIMQALRVSGDLSTEPVCNLLLGMGHPFLDSTQGVLQRFRRPIRRLPLGRAPIPSRCAATAMTTQKGALVSGGTWTSSSQTSINGVEASLWANHLRHRLLDRLAQVPVGLAPALQKRGFLPECF
jgi:hypothetical protein